MPFSFNVENIQNMFSSVTDFVAIRPKSSMSWQTVAHPLENFTTQSTHGRVLGREFLLHRVRHCSRTQVVELILGSIIWFSWISWIIASWWLSSYPVKQQLRWVLHMNQSNSAKQTSHNTCNKMCTWCLAIQKNWLTNHEEWCEIQLILRALWIHEPLINLSLRG